MDKKSDRPEPIKKEAHRTTPYRYRDFPISPVADPKTKAMLWRVTGHGDFATAQQAERYIDERISVLQRDLQGRPGV